MKLPKAKLPSDSKSGQLKGNGSGKNEARHKLPYAALKIDSPCNWVAVQKIEGPTFEANISASKDKYSKYSFFLNIYVICCKGSQAKEGQKKSHY